MRIIFVVLFILLDLNDLERTGKEMETYINSKMKDKDLSIIVIDHLSLIHI